MSNSLTLEYSCGHSRQYSWPRSGKNRPYRNNAHRDQMIAEASVGLCDCCARTRINQVTARESAIEQLPALDGTPRQVAWANTIRSEILEQASRVTDWDNEQHHYVSFVSASRQYAAYLALRGRRPGVDLTAEIHRELRAVNRAAWWIDRRSTRLEHLFLEIAVDLLSDRDDDGDAPVPTTPNLPTLEVV